MKTIDEMIEDVEDELQRSKNFVNSNGYHNGTALTQIVRTYRNELKKLLTIMIDDKRDGVVKYGETE